MTHPRRSGVEHGVAKLTATNSEHDVWLWRFGKGIAALITHDGLEKNKTLVSIPQESQWKTGLERQNAAHHDEDLVKRRTPVNLSSCETCES